MEYKLAMITRNEVPTELIVSQSLFASPINRIMSMAQIF